MNILFNENCKLYKKYKNWEKQGIRIYFSIINLVNIKKYFDFDNWKHLAKKIF